jgi:hypothetical protein
MTGHLPANGENFVAAFFEYDPIERPRRRTIKHLAGLRIKAALVTWTLEPVVRLRIINGTRQMCTLLTKCVITAVTASDQDRGVLVAGIGEIQRAAGLERVCSIDTSSDESGCLSRLIN